MPPISIVITLLHACIDNSSSFICRVLQGYFDHSLSFTSGGHVSYGYTFSVLWLVVSQTLNGLANLLVFPTVLQFIFAQAPRTMQGFFVGLKYAMLSINLGVSIIGNVWCAIFHWSYTIPQSPS